MRTSRVLFSVLHFFLGLGMIGMGVFFIALSTLPYLRSLFLQILNEQFYLFAWIGYTVLFLGLLLFVAFYFVNRGQYYQVCLSPPKKAEIDRELIRDYAAAFWDIHFPQESIETEVFVHQDQTIELIAEIPNLHLEKQERLLSLTEEKFGKILANKLGYDRKLLVTLVIK